MSADSSTRSRPRSLAMSATSLTTSVAEARPNAYYEFAEDLIQELATSSLKSSTKSASTAETMISESAANSRGHRRARCAEGRRP